MRLRMSDGGSSSARGSGLLSSQREHHYRTASNATSLGSPPPSASSSGTASLSSSSPSKSVGGVGATPQSQSLASEEAEDEQLLLHLENSARKAQSITDRMVIILEHFEEKLRETENSVVPINTVTSELRVVHSNLDQVISSADHVLSKFGLYNELREPIGAGPQKGRLSEYLRHLNRVELTIHFFETNRNFKSAPTASEDLNRLRTVGLANCERLWTDLLRRCSQPNDVELVPISQSRRKELEILYPPLAALCTGESAKEYGEIRAKFVLDSIRPKAAYDPSLEYEVQGARLVDLFEFYTAIMEHERSVALQIYPQSTMESVLEQVIEPSFELFMKTAESFLKGQSEVSYEKLFVLLDVHEALGRRMRSLNIAVQLYSNRFNEKLNTLVEGFEREAKHSLTDFQEYLIKNNVRVGADGNVHPLSSTTLNYLKRLLPKRVSLEFLVGHWQSEEVTLADIVFTMLKELSVNLQSKSRKEQKKQPILANIFLLNNYHYILHTMKTSNLLQGELLAKFVAEYESAIYTEVATYRASWNSALAWLLDINVKSSATVDNMSIKKKFVGFNKAIEKRFHTQKLFTIPNHNLRAQLREELKEDVLPLYAGFLERYADVAFSSNRSKYERYSVATLSAMLDKFFED